MAELVLALDVADRAAALRLLDGLPDVRWVKVGAILAVREGPALVQELAGRGLAVFLDLKWHDIPNTVSGAVEAAGALGVRMATVHALGGAEMMAAAAQAAPQGMALVAVTVLTSHTTSSYAEAVGVSRVDLGAAAVRQAKIAVSAGLAGVVSSSHEVGALRRSLGPGPRLVVPGIRRAADPRGDQHRTASPGEAVRAGADFLVVGRPVLQAEQPAPVWRALLEEMA